MSVRSRFTHQRVFQWLPVSEYPLPAHRRHSLGLPVSKPFSFTHRMGPLALSVSRTAISLSRINCPVLPPAIYQASGPQAMPDTIYNFARQSFQNRKMFKIPQKHRTKYRKSTGQNSTKTPDKMPRKYRTAIGFQKIKRRKAESHPGARPAHCYNRRQNGLHQRRWRQGYTPRMPEVVVNPG